MSLGGINYNQNHLNRSTDLVNEVVDSAIADHTQYSLRKFRYEGYLRVLNDLYEKNELTSAINRVIEGMNHRFTIDVQISRFKSHDLGVSKYNSRRDRNNLNDDPEAIANRLKIF